MARRNNNGFGPALILIAAPFFYLHDKLGDWLFWILAGIIFIWVCSAFSRSDKNQQGQPKPRKQKSDNFSKSNSTRIPTEELEINSYKSWANIVNTSKKSSEFQAVNKLVKDIDGNEYIEIDWPATFLIIEQAVAAKDFDFARTWLQKFFYTTVNKEVPQYVRDHFKVLMTAFVQQDPLYLKLIAKILPIIEAHPGIMQTAIYPQLTGYNEEQIRYVLYFANELGDVNRLKKGRSYQIFGPIIETVIQSGEQLGATVVNANLVIRKNPIDDRIAELHREATTHKSINWEAAVNCLTEASDLMRRQKGHYTIDRWTRLPIFLQQAGRFNEAMQEFEQLLIEVEDRVRQECPENTSKACIDHMINLNYQTIYDKMRMVCKRQKKLEEANRYSELSAHYDEKVKALRIIVDLELETERKAYDHG